MTKKTLSLLALSALCLAVIGCGSETDDTSGIQIVSCPEDAKVCDDGTIVTREGVDCEFAACPDTSQLDEEPAAEATAEPTAE